VQSHQKFRPFLKYILIPIHSNLKTHFQTFKRDNKTLPLTMPSAISLHGSERITKFTNCRLVKGEQLVYQDLWVSSLTGKIVRSQEAFYDQHATPDATIDMGGRIIAPGLIDVQLNGAFGFDFSVIPEDDPSSYGKTLRQVNKSLVQTGVTSYLPTLTSQRKAVYHHVSVSTFSL
jgi:N-acetylglucosamine-6-phosphate deacetylase